MGSLRLSYALLALVAIFALLAIIYLHVQSGLGRLANSVVVGVLGFSIIAMTFRWRTAICHAIAGVAERLNVLRPAAFWGVLAVFGIGGRVIAYLLLQPVAASDGAIYLALAKRLFEESVYIQPPDEFDPAGCRACFPPGLPLTLYMIYKVFGVRDCVPLVLNMLLLFGQILVVRSLAQKIGAAKAFRLAAFVFALWPSLFLYSLTPNKELLSGLLVLAALACFLQVLTQGRTLLYVLVLSPATGALCGLAALTQPSTLLLPFALAAIAVVLQHSVRRALAVLVIVGVAMAAVIAPWTYRNTQVLGAPVPISTSGGFNFYMVNNPLATGSWTPTMERDLRGYGEVERNRIGMRWGTEWIKEHPLDFLILFVRKQTILLGRDNTGAYWAIERGTDVRGWPLQIARGISAGFWLLLWVALLAGALRRIAAVQTVDRFAALLLAPFAYLLLVHGVFEAQAKHHLNVAASLVLVAVFLACNSDLRSRDPKHSG
jgi:4-amino-4-deoxy-L-arabinose transferase-like glycosyltransferase